MNIAEDASSSKVLSGSSPITWKGIEETINRKPFQAFAILTAVYFVVVSAMSSFKLLWLDELITLHIASLATPHDIWRALAQGADPNPPVTHLLVHYSQLLFGHHEFVFRLPAAIGYWVGLLSLFVYLKRYIPGTWAIAGTVLSMTMAAFEYSFESRSYGIFYGLAMFAFLCWTWSVLPSLTASRRTMALLGWTFALALGISTNYFAVLAFVPIAAGELTRTYQRAMRARGQSRHSTARAYLQAIDLRIWLALAIAGSSLLIYLPLISRAVKEFAPYAWNKVSLGQVADSYTEMVEVVLYPILAMFAFAVVVFSLRHFRESLHQVSLPRWLNSIVESASVTRLLPVSEAVGIFAFMLYPMLGYVLASIHGGMLSPRFVIPVCFGFAVAATLLGFKIFSRFPNAGPIFLLFVTAWFLCRESYVGYAYEEQKQCFYKIVKLLPQADQTVPNSSPIVIPDPLLALTFQYYAPRQFAEREVFPIDFAAIRAYRHDDSPEENLWAGRNTIYSLPIVPLALFEQRSPSYLIIAANQNWMLKDLQNHRSPAEPLPIDTRAGAIGGFTPLAKGTPGFYVAGPGFTSDRIDSSLSLPRFISNGDGRAETRVPRPNGARD